MKKPSIIIIIVVIILALILITALIYFSNKEKYAIDSSTSNPPAISMTSTPSQSVAPSTITAPSSSISDTFNKNAKIPDTTVLISEIDNASSLFYLGMTRDAVTAILKDKGIYYNMTEISNEGVTHGDYVIDFYLFDDDFNLFFNKQTYLLYKFQILGENPVNETSTRLGFNLGDDLDKLVKLYGKDYEIIKTVHDGYPVYSFKIGDHFFQVQFLANGITRWGISESVEEKDDVYSSIQFLEKSIINMIGGYTPDDVIKHLGKPDKITNTNSFERWNYNKGLEIDFVKQNDIPRLFNYIYLDSASTIKTNRNIGIGSSRNDVMKAYADEIKPANVKDNMIIAGDRGGGIIFLLEKDVVTTIYVATGAYTTPDARDIPK